MAFPPGNTSGIFPLQPIPLEKLSDLDSLFEPIGCIGQGTFGSCFLARKKSSGRTIALKVVPLNPLDVDNDEPLQEVEREVQHVRRLNDQSIKSENDCRDLSIVFFEEWYLQRNLFACIVMKYVPGGTLAEELERTMSTGLPYTERRIAWYALQLAEALQFAHERGVAHHDVKSANCLIDCGGKLLLADFGSAVAPGEDSVGFTKSYAAPELLEAFERDDYTGLRPDKIDAFGLGCILYELLCSKNLAELGGDKTLGQFIQHQGVDAALNLPILKLPWLPATPSGNVVVGYSDALRRLVKALLEPNPQNRSLPSHLPEPLRADRFSPLLRDHVAASHALYPGAAVTVDNVQLGMFVQRGHDWDDKNADGGLGRIGVVVRLDPDANYTEVAWSHFDSQLANDGTSSTTCYRIGAGDKFELQVGPTQLPDFIGGTDRPMETGLFRYAFDDISSRYLGEMLNQNCIVVGIHDVEKRLFVAPLESISLSTIAQPAPFRSVVRQTAYPRKSQPPPDTWKRDGNLLVELGEDTSERSDVLEALYSTHGGLDIQQIELVSIKRVESPYLWSSFAQASDAVAAENWGIANQQRLFVGAKNICPERLLRSGVADFFAGMFVSAEDMGLHVKAKRADLDAYRDVNGIRTLILARVALGRKELHATAPGFNPTFHHSSVCGLNVRKTAQAYPEYFIQFKHLHRPSSRHRRLVRAVRPLETASTAANVVRAVRPLETASTAANVASRASIQSSPGPQALGSNDPSPLLSEGMDALRIGVSASKQCVVCMSNPVKRVLVPCGHLCLCQICSTEQGLAKLRRQCPECRSKISQAVTIYGRVVDD